MTEDRIMSSVVINFNWFCFAFPLEEYWFTCLMNWNLKLSFRSDLDLSGRKRCPHGTNSYTHFRCIYMYLCEGKICSVYKFMLYSLFLHACASLKVHVYKAWILRESSNPSVQVCKLLFKWVTTGFMKKIFHCKFANDLLWGIKTIWTQRE